nr:protein SIEVE ELEMENT OCCLUSION B-like [Ipomoea trifida]
MATQPFSPSRTMISQLQMSHVEEKIIIEQVKDTHNMDGGLDVDANRLLKFVEDIFNLNTRQMGLDEFEGEGVLLLISSGKYFLYYAYNAAHTGVEKIWVPIINDVDEDIQMPDSFYDYYRVLDLQSGIAPAFLRFLQDKCFPTFQVGGDPILISLDKRGRLVHSNALHMIFTWGIQLSERRTMRSCDIIPSLENELRERTSGADRVIDDIDKQIHNFAREVRQKINDWVDDIETKMKSSIVDDEKYIFLCGGNNIKRVLEFVHKIEDRH